MQWANREQQWKWDTVTITELARSRLLTFLSVSENIFVCNRLIFFYQERPCILWFLVVQEIEKPNQYCNNKQN